jgi:Flp pilus assembly pilin Flp
MLRAISRSCHLLDFVWTQITLSVTVPLVPPTGVTVNFTSIREIGTMNRLYVMLITLFGEVEERADSMQERAHEDRGAAMVEYGLLVVGIAIVVGVAAATLGGKISTMFGGVL